MEVCVLTVLGMETEGGKESGMIDGFYLARAVILYIFNTEQWQTDTEQSPCSAMTPNAQKRPSWWISD